MSSLLGVAKEADEFYVLNITDNYKARLVKWFEGLEARLVSSLKAGTSVALIGPHGVGKSVVARYVAAILASEYYAVIDLGADVASFDNLLEVLPEVPNAVGFYDPLGINFYDNPLVPRAELAAAWMERCNIVVDRAFFLNTRGVSSLIVLPRALFELSPCREQVEKVARVVDMAEYLRHVNYKAAAREVFNAHAVAMGCRTPQADAYIDYVAERHRDLSGLFALAVYGAKAYVRRRCAQYDPQALYRDALEELAKLYYQLYKYTFFPTCEKARAISVALLLSLQGEYLPPAVAQVLPNAAQIARQLAILAKLSIFTDVVKLVAEEILEELRELYTPREEFAASIKWATGPKESVVAEALKLKAGEIPCLTQPDLENIRAVYRGLLLLSPEFHPRLAEAIARVALSGDEACGGEMRDYICHGGSVSKIVLDALGGRRVTLEMPPPLPRVECGWNDLAVLTAMALVDARRAPHGCVERVVQILASRVAEDPQALVRFYKLYRDYIDVAVDRGAPPVLRQLAMAHYLGAVPQEAIETLKRLVSAALEYSDFKTAEVALAALAKIDPTEAARSIPNCDCPILKVSALYTVALRLIEKGLYKEALKIAEELVAEVRRGGERYEYTEHFVRAVEDLYKEVAIISVL